MYNYVITFNCIYVHIFPQINAFGLLNLLLESRQKSTENILHPVELNKNLYV